MKSVVNCLKHGVNAMPGFPFQIAGVWRFWNIVSYTIIEYFNLKRHLKNGCVIFSHVQVRLKKCNDSIKEHLNVKEELSTSGYCTIFRHNNIGIATELYKLFINTGWKLYCQALLAFACLVSNVLNTVYLLS
jgi:hypothetical protein